jgi:single-strand DNA-binding protein
MTVNKVILLGNLGKDPETRTVASSGMMVANFSLATTEKRKDQSGAWVSQTEWHRIVAFGKLAEFCSNYLKKGSSVYIEGKIKTNKWQDKEGKDRYTTDIIADTIRFAGGNRDRSESQSYASAGGSFDGSAALSNDGPPPADDNSVSFDDDDIPF